LFLSEPQTDVNWKPVRSASKLTELYEYL